MAKNYISNSTDSPRIFKSGMLEPLSKVHFSIPLYIFIPIIAYCIYRDFTLEKVQLVAFIGYFIGGLFIWTFTEYFLHRFVFHFTPHNDWQERIHFIFHGVHHDYPRDRKRLVMPPSVSLPLAFLFYLLFKAIFSSAALFAFFPGFLLGYLCYDMMHYAMHHYTFKTNALKRIQQHHMLHHYQDPLKGFGVTSDLWDKVFHSESVMKNKLTKEKK
ncbi:sterol desaturase family protein [Rhizosphaericola mali]|uniref:Fatty acid hydroxylase n=1 Tax=Rhizosphaericola mali TaxID=2545455 RepID=A0A5P2FVD7_9BACT|nr:sterol desaturase family protein [Rhizosphaericola mali]QES87454.1 fatty acid hydroxylase [Rhizosphaericola mali]